MNRIEYGKTARKLLLEATNELFQKKVVFEIEIEKYKTKGSLREEDKDEFQVSLAKFMKDNQIRTFVHDVCLSIEIHVHQKNSPSIHQIPKTYIDLIEKVVSKRIKRRKFLLIKNDKNIRILNVNYIRSQDIRNRIVFTLYPFSVVRKAINVLYRFKYEYYNLLDEDFSKLKDRKEEQSSGKDDFEILDEFVRMSEEDIRGKLKTDDLIWYMSCKRRLQESYFGNISEYDYFPLEIFFNRISFYAYSDLKKEIKNRKQTTIQSPEDGIMKALEKIDEISYNFQIKLPENPQRTGGSVILKKKMSAAMKKITDKNTYLSPMFIPLSVLIIFTPGKNDIDVDNLAKKFVIPIVEEYLEPPSDYYSRIKEDDLRYQMTQIAKSNKKAFDYSQLQFFKNNSIRNYECIKLHRLPNEKNGFIHICLYSEIVNVGFLDRLQSRLFDYEVD